MPYKFACLSSGTNLKFFKADPSNGNLYEQLNFNAQAGFGTGAPGTPIAACGLPNTTGSWNEYHVYYLNTSGVLQERYWTPTGGWTTGTINSLNYVLQASTSLTAAIWTTSSGSLQIRVYGTNTSGNIAEIAWGVSSGWILNRTVG
ncbi:hypothetical protein TWF694_005520 [Orbilia ellipsospora]|uniref:Fucose-specific lectin n=1 Tax=Orbilia ellipsospora TaxID=2528407 RepID=A0AAV9WTH8_9PEZI